MSKSGTDDHSFSDTLAETYDTVSEKVVSAYGAARDTAIDVGHTTVTGIDGNPAIALVGGLILGALLGALLPRGNREHTLLAPVGGRFVDAAQAAFGAAKTAGIDALAEAGMSEDNLRQQASRFFEQASKAATVAGSAAFSAARDAATK